jgi:hypothetical protein
LLALLPPARADGEPDPAFWSGGEVVLQLPYDMHFGGLDADAQGNLALAFYSPLFEGVDPATGRPSAEIGAYCEINPASARGRTCASSTSPSTTSGA